MIMKDDLDDVVDVVKVTVVTDVALILVSATGWLLRQCG
jgi:hypothetical protein